MFEWIPASTACDCHTRLPRGGAAQPCCVCCAVLQSCAWFTSFLFVPIGCVCAQIFFRVHARAARTAQRHCGMTVSPAEVLTSSPVCSCCRLRVWWLLLTRHTLFRTVPESRHGRRVGVRAVCGGVVRSAAHPVCQVRLPDFAIMAVFVLVFVFLFVCVDGAEVVAVFARCSPLVQPSSLTMALKGPLHKLAAAPTAAVLEIEVEGPWTRLAQEVREAITMVYMDELQEQLRQRGLLSKHPKPSGAPREPPPSTQTQHADGPTQYDGAPTEQQQQKHPRADNAPMLSALLSVLGVATPTPTASVSAAAMASSLSGPPPGEEEAVSNAAVGADGTVSDTHQEEKGKEEEEKEEEEEGHVNAADASGVPRRRHLPDLTSMEGLRQAAPEIMREFDNEVEDSLMELESELFAGYLLNPKYVRVARVAPAPL